jgi:hypothetical protein
MEIEQMMRRQAAILTCLRLMNPRNGLGVEILLPQAIERRSSKPSRNYKFSHLIVVLIPVSFVGVLRFA